MAIEWKIFSPKALDFLANSNARLNILYGSVRSSKTVNCTVRWLQYIRSGPRGDLAMLGKTMATLQRNVLNDLFDIVGPKNYKWINRQSGELIVLGRRIYCFGANNEDAESKIRGATFAGSLCDEVNLYPQSVFNQLMARMSVPGAQCFCNCNPDSPFHWFYTDYIMNDQITNKKIWKFTLDDNLSLDPEYIMSLKQMYTGVWYERMIDGNWAAAEGLVYDQFDRKKHVVDAVAQIREAVQNGIHPHSIQWLVGCDYGTATVMSWGLYAKLPSGLIYKVREYYWDAVKRGRQQTDGEFVKDFGQFAVIPAELNPVLRVPQTPPVPPSYPFNRNLVGVQNRGITTTLTSGSGIEAVYCDPSAASWKQELLRKSYKVFDGDNDVVNGIRKVSSYLTCGKFFIDKSCENTIKEYSTYAWDPKAQKLGQDKVIKSHDHTCDTDRYVIYTSSQFELSGTYGVA